MAFDWKAVGRRVADAAPMLGTALGGPAGAAIGAIVASTLGTANNPEEVMARLQADPEALMRLKELEQLEQDSIRQHTLAMAQAELADQQQARAVHKEHWMPSVLTLGLAAMVSLIVLGLMFVAVPDNSKEVLFYLAGQVVTAFLTAVAFWLGSSRSSSDKNRVIESITK
jgi:hypothetical protein